MNPYEDHPPLCFDGVNMTNCFKHSRRFFEKYESIDGNLLIAYWMMAGYLGRVDSVQEAYERGYRILMELTHKGMIYVDTSNKIAGSTDSNLDHCCHEGICTTPNLGFFDLLDLSQIDKVTLTNGMLMDKKGSFLLLKDQLWRSIPWEDLSYCKRLKYLACFDSRPISMERLLENVNNPSALLFRGCENWTQLSFSLEKLSTLTVLDLSTSNLIDVPEVSQLTQIQYLYLTFDLPQLPEECFCKLKQLRWLILRKSFSIRTLPSIQDLSNLEVLDLFGCTDLRRFRSDMIGSPKLQVLDLSNTKLRSIPALETTKLTHLILRGSILSVYGKIKHPSSLQKLDLAGAKVEIVDLSQHDDLVVLDLSRTQISSIDSVSDKVHLRKLILRQCESLQELPALEKLESLEVLDVSSCKQLTDLPDLRNLRKLEVLDLSGTKVKRLPFFAKPSCLRKLSIRGLRLDSLETLASLSNLVELDLSGVKISSSEEFKVDILQSLENLQILNLSQTSVAEITAMAKLVSLKELLLADCPHLNTLPDLNSLVNLEKLDLSISDDSQAKEGSEVQRGLLSLSVPSIPLELVLTNRSGVKELNAEDEVEHKDEAEAEDEANQPSGFDQINQQTQITKLIDLISEIRGTSTNTVTNSDDNAYYKRQIEVLRMDLEFIKKHINNLKSSPNSNRAEELLRHLIDSAQLSEDDLAPDSPNFQKLLHTVAKLKLLVPRMQTSSSKSSETIQQKKDSQYSTSKGNKNAEAEIAEELVILRIPQVETAHLLSSYESLNNNQKHCLMCFSAFPCDVQKSLEIKKKLLIYWWAGEGFIDLHRAAQRGKKRKTVEEIGEQILKAFTEKGFIEPVIEKSWETRRCRMRPFVHSFVTEQAKRDGFFDFREDGKLKTSFTHSHRACLLKSQDRFLSSCQVWEMRTKSREKLKRFETVRTLFNVNESFIYIQPEWFSKMKDLSVLYLGSWKSGTEEHMEVVEQKFMEDLKNMKQLKLFSLQGVSTIMTLPDSVCKLTNLVILDLRKCHTLEELPAGIGSLKNLTHLDMTNCHLLTKMPKGISLLSKLEVLRGFAICDEAGEPQHKKACILGRWWKKAKACVIHDLLRCKKKEICTLRDLLKLEKLRELGIVVNRDNFPSGEELKTFKEMQNIRKLKISWERSFKIDKKSDSSGQTDADQGDNNLSAEEIEPEAQNAIGQEALTAHKCVELMKCCKPQSSQKEREKKSRREFLDQIEKLELWCFPHETAPDWLVPNQLKNLQKLYIRGGKLKKLPGGTNGNKWKVKTLRLTYLPDLEITWMELKAMFPNLTYLVKHECSKPVLFPCDQEGVWKKEI